MTATITKKSLGNLELFEISCEDANAEISTFGAQAISWNLGGTDIFYANPSIITDKSKPLRAGAPICFPWFNKGLNWQLGKEIAPSHGPARNTEWQVNTGSASNKLKFDFETKSHLQLPLKISVTYSLTKNSLHIEFVVSNLSAQSNAFELALHSYFASSHPEEIEIQGLKDFKGAAFNPELPIDKIFENAGNILQAAFSDFNLEIENNGFSKSVIWHPGLTHQLSDLPKDPSPVPFLCLESLSEKIELAALDEWKGSVLYSVI